MALKNCMTLANDLTSVCMNVNFQKSGLYYTVELLTKELHFITLIRSQVEHVMSLYAHYLSSIHKQVM